MAKALKIKIIDLDNKEKEDINLPSDIFSTEIKEEIVAKVVNWQMSKKRQGTHAFFELTEKIRKEEKRQDKLDLYTF